MLKLFFDRRKFVTKPEFSLGVYLGKSGRVDQKYKDLAFQTGGFVARQGWELVYGGSKTGTMGLVADGALAAGGQVYGVITNFLKGIEEDHEGLTELVVVSSMHERKKTMLDRADGFLILPGGLGTMDEFFEILTWRQIGIHDKPIVVLNFDGFFDKVIELIQHFADTDYILPQHLSLYRVVDTLDQVPDALFNNQADRTNHHMQWI
jgi:uncharacterized protein (TIGR00730 family)